MNSLIALTFLTLLPSVASAAERGGSTDLYAAGMKLLGALGLVLGVILLFYALSRRSMVFLLNKKGQTAITVKEIKYLQPKKALCLVEVRGEELLLGIGSERIELIARLQPASPSSFEEALAESAGEVS